VKIVRDVITLLGDLSNGAKVPEIPFIWLKRPRRICNTKELDYISVIGRKNVSSVISQIIYLFIDFSLKKNASNHN
jgi:hypothetical protein